MELKLVTILHNGVVPGVLIVPFMELKLMLYHHPFALYES